MVAQRELICLVVALFVVYSNAEPPQKVVGGTPAYPGEFPYQVSIRIRNKHSCGGVIISKRHVLTSAACAKAVLDFQNADVLSGSVTVNEGQLHKIKSVWYHTRYDEQLSGTPYDIGIVALVKEMVFNNYQNKVNLPTGPAPVNAVATVTGWGYNKNTYNYVPTLSKAQVRTISASQCHSLLHDTHTIWNNQICAQATVGVGICSGDEGGPLVYKNQLIGIVSWGFPCARGYPDVYTSVYNFLDWINYHLRST